MIEYNRFLPTGLPVSGFINAFLLAATMAGYVTSSPRSFMAMALRATMAWFLGVMTDCGPCDSCIDLPGNQSRSALIFSKSCEIADGLGQPPTRPPTPTFFTLHAMKGNIP